jgi:hypothetical protein
LKLGLKPLINNLNYANNVSELYEQIIEKWIGMLRVEVERFKECDIKEYRE